MANLIKKAEFNSALDGYVVEFESGAIAHLQYTECSDALHADQGERLLERYAEYDEGELTEAEEEALQDFIDANQE